MGTNLFTEPTSYFNWVKILFLVIVAQFITTIFLKAEGTVDFINYPGYRLMLFAERQQQTKVYAKEGEFINFGASHVGITGGFINVYRPDGTLHSTYDNTGASSGLAIINSNVEELNGPTGGGATMGSGYTPGVVEVMSGEEGAWSITFEYPTYTNAPFDNLLNSDPWERMDDQPLNQRVVLAWDITVSQGSAGNSGGNLLTGRVYTNEYQSIVNFNGNLTSPTFYILTPDGFQYQVDFDDVDPWGFPIFSNNWGIVKGNITPTYTSWEDEDITRSTDVNSWDAAQTYIYEPQAEDTDFLINNKVFFNVPNSDLPSETLTTDIYRNNTHTTWLLNPPAPIEVEVNDVFLIADQTNADGEPVYNAYEPVQGAWFTFKSTLAGTVRLDLDFNKNGSFSDPEDITLITRTMGGSLDSIRWDGRDGTGQLTTTPQDLEIPYQLQLFGGEIHIMMGDVENVLGGVTFSRINGDGLPADTFYYDHRNIGAAASGDATTGPPQPTVTPFAYSDNFGNRKTLDYWTYVAFAIQTSVFYIDIVEDLEDGVAFDSDGDTVRDDKDIDDDNDGIPDRLEYCLGAAPFSCLPNMDDPSGDNDDDGILNFMDANDPLYFNLCNDINSDGICDNILSIYDWDGDSVPNHLDLDSDNDGISDAEEANHNQPDTDQNGIIDGDNNVFQANGLYNPIATNSDDLEATITYTISDTDQDGIPDFLDLDSDNDGITDLAESGHNLLTDNNNNGLGDGNFPLALSTKGLLPEINPNLTGQGIPLPLNSDDDDVEDYKDRDSDNDGYTDVLEGGNFDGDNDGVNGLSTPNIDAFGVVITDGNGNLVPYATSTPPDSDNDNYPDYRDLDSDNDGIHDVVEGNNLDTDNNGIIGIGMPNVDTFGMIQTDGNGTAMSATSLAVNTDNDTYPDYQDLDSDNDGINDVLEGGNLDSDNDGFVGAGAPTVNDLGQVVDGTDILSTSLVTNTDNDTYPDYQDLDSDNDGINDVLEGGNLDSDNDGIVGAGAPTVNDLGQVVDGTDILSTSLVTNTDNDTYPDYQDLDSDNDGINDVLEGGNLDSDNDGIVGAGAPTVNDLGQVIQGSDLLSMSNPSDTDSDNVPDYQDLDSDNDGINDVLEGGNLDSDNDGIVGIGIPAVNNAGQVTDGGIILSTSNPIQTDGDNIPDFQDLDADNDGINDVVEGGNFDPDNDGFVGTGVPTVNAAGQPSQNGNTVSNSNPTDTDNDGTADYQDLDADNDGINDVVEGGSDDPDNDGIVGIDEPTVNIWGQVTVGADVVSTSNPTNTDMDGVADYQDLDADNDGINDVVEGGLADPDNDGIVGTGSPIINNNGQVTQGGILVSNSFPTQTDGDNVADYQDLDADNDGINDVVEGGASDPDNDGIVGTGVPTVNDAGQPTDGAVVVSTSDPANTDNNGNPDYQDLDSDNDGINDVVEGGAIDPDNDGIIGTGVPTVNDAGQPTDGGTVVSTSNPTDTDGNGDPDFQDLDSDDDGLEDAGECVGGSPCSDFDNDGNPDYQDIDSDNDGIVDAYECPTGFPCPDTDGNGDTNQLDLDSDEDGILDENECAQGAPCPDFDNDGADDYVDVDSDDDGLLDEVECSTGFPCPDLDDDGNPDQLDVDCSTAVETAALSSSTTVCEGEDITVLINNSQNYFTAHPSSVIEFNWTNTTTGQIINTGTNPSLTVPTSSSMASTQTFMVMVSIDGCNSETSQALSVAITPAPVANILNTTPVICEGENIQLNAETVANASYMWRIAGTNTVVSNDQNPVINSVMSNTSYELVVSTPDCSTEATDQVLVTVTEEPVINMMASTLSFCTEEQVVLTASTPSNISGNITYMWEDPMGLTFSQTVAATDNFEWNLGMANTINTGAYQLTIETEQGCSSFTEAIQVEVANDLAQPQLELSSDLACEGSTVFFTIPNANYTNVTYNWMYQGLVFESTTTPFYELDGITMSNAGAYFVEVVSENCGTVQSLLTSLSIIDTSDEPTSDNSTLAEAACAGSDVELRAQEYPEAFYTWYGPSNNVLPNQTGSFKYTLQNVTKADEGDYYATVDLTHELDIDCEPLTSQTTLVRVNEEITNATIVAASQSVCQDDDIVLTITNDIEYNPTDYINYQWYFIDMEGDQTFITITANPSLLIPQVTTGDAGTYHVLVDMDGCITNDFEPIEIAVSSIPDQGAFAGLDEAICGEEMYVLNAAPISIGTGQWTSVSGATIINPSEASTLVVDLQEGDNTFVWSLSNGACEGYQVDSVTISLSIPDELADAGADVALACDEDSYQLAAISPTVGAGQWTSLTGATIANPNMPTAMAENLVPGDNIFVWSLSVGSCSNYATDTVVVALNTPTEAAIAGNDMTECGNSTIQLAATPATQGAGVWTSVSGATISNPTEANTMVTDLQEGENVFVWTLSNGGCTNYASDEVVITYYATDEVAQAGSDQSLCAATEFQLNADFPTVGTGQWTTQSGATIANANQANTMVTDLQEGDNVFTWSLSNGNCDNYSEDTVIITYNPTVDEATLLIDNELNLCLDDLSMATMLEAATPQLATGTWTQTVGPSVAVIADANAAVTEVSSLGEGFYVFTWTLTQDDCQDFNETSLVINISETPDEGAFVMDNQMVTCINDEIIIEAVEPQVSEGEWIALTDGINILDADNPITTISGLSMGQNQLVWVLSHENCSNYSFDTLTVVVEEGVNTNDDVFVTEYGQALTNFNVLSNDEFDTDANWSVNIADEPSSGQATINAAGEVSYVPNQAFSGTDQFTYILCNESCGDCQEAFVVIEVQAEEITDCFVPNIITPNNDGFNDALTIPCVTSFPNNEIKIFNRWGDKVYEAEGYTNDWEGFYNSTLLPSGTYFYIFKKQKDGEETMQGYITIYR